MPTFRQGDTIKIPFPYTDRATRQRRPAVVISNGGLGEDGALLWVAMITSADNRPWPGDLPLADSQRSAGLAAPSVIRPCKIATLAAAHAEPLGAIDPALLARALRFVADQLGM